MGFPENSFFQTNRYRSNNTPIGVFAQSILYPMRKRPVVPVSSSEVRDI
jgi:hypothetical protein